MQKNKFVFIRVHSWLRILLSLYLLTTIVKAEDRPNILWIVSEDNGARWLGCYGNPAKPTPTLDRLAQEGFRFTNCHAAIPVCAPQRFTWITGINALSCGTQGMRSGVEIPKHIRFYPEIFRGLGYYTSKGNDAKTDYNYKGRNANDSWNEPKKLNWNTLSQKQPFIHVINTHSTHESRSFGGFNADKDNPPTAQNRAAYHPDLPRIHHVSHQYNQCLEKMDQEVAGWLNDLEKNGLAHNTIVIYSSDHGGVLPRSKRFLYNSGTHCPLIVHIPEKFKHLYPAEQPGDTITELVSFTDFPKTWLNLGGASKEDLAQMQGRSFLGNTTEPAPKVIFSFRGRMDERLDLVRSARNHQFLYIRNYMPFAPIGQYLPYLYNSQATKAWRQHHLDGKTNQAEAHFFKQPRAIEELYHHQDDYDNVHNLATDKSHTHTIKQLRTALRDWQLSVFDSGFLPEKELGRQAKKHDLFVYDYIRKPELYPLADLIDMADKSLELDPKNIPTFLQALQSEQIGLRYWATLGLLNLTFHGQEATPEIKTALTNILEKEESEITQAYAAWTLIRLGETDQGLSALTKLSNGYAYSTVVNILDWMTPDLALPLTYDLYLTADPKKQETKLLVNLLELHAPAELVNLVQENQKLPDQIKHRTNKLKEIKANKKGHPQEKVATQLTKTQQELDAFLNRQKELPNILKEWKNRDLTK